MSTFAATRYLTVSKIYLDAILARYPRHKYPRTRRALYRRWLMHDYVRMSFEALGITVKIPDYYYPGWEAKQ